MKQNQFKRVALLFIIVAVPSFSWYFLADSDENTTLFDVTRNLDDDKLNYDLNLDSEGNLVSKKPIHPYWIRNSDGGVVKELNGIQRKFAYGLKYLKQTNGTYVFQFVSYKKRNFFLRKDKKGTYKVYTNVGKEFVIVRNLHLQVTKNGDSPFDMPKLSYIDINYERVVGGVERSKRIYIKEQDY